MALILCPECGKQVSELAPMCPACGYPISKSGSRNGATKITKIIDGNIVGPRSIEAVRVGTFGLRSKNSARGRLRAKEGLIVAQMFASSRPKEIARISDLRRIIVPNKELNEVFVEFADGHTWKFSAAKTDSSVHGFFVDLIDTYGLDVQTVQPANDCGPKKYAKVVLRTKRPVEIVWPIQREGHIAIWGGAIWVVDPATNGHIFLAYSPAPEFSWTLIWDNFNPRR